MKYTTIAIVLASMLASSGARAQQQSDPSDVQRIVNILQRQRNQALDAAADAEIRAAALADQLARVQARLKELDQPKKD